MKCWVLSVLDSGFAIMDENFYVCEFSKSELILLSKFIHVIGVSSDGEILISVYRIFHSYGTYTCSLYAGFGSVQWLDSERKNYMLNEGYYLVTCSDMLGNPDLIMRYGVKALVTDMGRLISAASDSDTPIVLVNFCKVLCDGSLNSGLTTIDNTYVLDDRIESVSDNFAVYLNSHSSVDLSGMSNIELKDRIINILERGTLLRNIVTGRSIS